MERFGPYELLGRLGAGGMAETYLAVRRGPGGFEQHVCLKRIHPAFEQDEEFVRLFLEEARVSARLRHANIAQVLDFGVVEGSHFLVLELIEGLDLRRLTKEMRKAGETLTAGVVSYVAYELGAALAVAHGSEDREMVVHRDISPSNVLVSTAGEVKLTDFGIAKAMSGAAHATRTGVVKGKVPYMAPEYARSGTSAPTVDLFALGVMLFEMLAGRRPFEGATDLDTLEKITSGDHPPLSELAPHAPPKLIDAVERLIEPDVESRFESASAFLDALVDVAPPPTARRILAELVKRHRARSDDTDIALIQTELASPSGPAPGGGTVHLGAKRMAASPAPVAAPSDAETRTRLPDGVRGETQGTSGGAATGTQVSDPPTMVDDPRTTVDDAPPTQQSPRAPSLPAAEAAPARGRAPLVAVAALLLLGAGSAGTYFAMKTDTPPATEVASAPRTEPAATEEPEPEPEPEPPAREVRAPDPETTEAPTETVPTEVAPTRRTRPRMRATPMAATPMEAATMMEAAETPPAMEPERADPPPQMRPANGRLRVVVVPYGEVSIDGRSVGSAPILRSLPAGEHTVRASSGSRSRSREVTIDPGETETLTFRLR